MLAALMICAAAPALAQCPSPLTFEINFVPSAKPPRPQLEEPVTFFTLEKFRADIEVYRQVSMEGYNLRLQRYGEALNRQDEQARAKFRAGTCTADQYAAFAEAIVEELSKLGREYLDIYREAGSFYRIDYETYRRTLFDCANGTIDCHARTQG
jgi:hypothetical protein